MAQPTTRSELIDYCLRSLGAPVLEINVAIEQIEDRYSEDIKLSYCITPDKVYNFEKQY
jgi:hypothetical protein